MAYELEKSIGFKINQTANKLNNKYSQILHPFDIAPEQRATLEIIKYETDVNQTKIAQILGKDKTTISRTLATLEKKGFILKSQINKRTNLIKISPLGEEILEKSSKLVSLFRKSLGENFDELEIEKLFMLLEKVTINLKEEL